MIYLDNSATTKQYPEVTRLMIDYMDESFGNPSSLYQLGVDSEKAIKTARRQVEKAMGVGAEGGRLYFSRNGVFCLTDPVRFPGAQSVHVPHLRRPAGRAKASISERGRAVPRDAA